MSAVPTASLKRKAEEPTAAASPSKKQREEKAEKEEKEEKDGKPASAEPKVHRKENGILLTFGSGDMGQLGLGMGIRERKFPAIVKGGLGENFVDIAAGSLQTLALTKDGRVFSWGCNDGYALGRGDISEDSEFSPGEITGFDGKRIIQVKTGAAHGFALTDDGFLYTWGSYKDITGSLGHSKGVSKQTFPVLLDDFPSVKGVQKKIVRIASGESLGLALMEDGSVFQWGDVNFGKRQSDRHRSTRVVPSVVTFRKSKGVAKEDIKITDVFAGGNSCFALASSGRLWVWGPNNYGQTGISRGDKEMAVAAPTLIPGLENVKEVAASTHHSFFLTKDHKVFSCGRGHSYRLGHGDEKETDVPSEIVGLTSLPEDDKVLSIATGEAHGMAVTAAGNLYTWGYGDLLQLGNGDEKDEKVPRMVTSAQLTDKEKRNVVRAAAGSQHSVIIATDA